MTVFVDTGKVFSDLNDFDFEDLHTGYGFGLRVHTPGGFRLRFDLAHSVEGFKLHISSGPSF
jgi:outer membrane translocation and assembly module TamA